MNPINEGLRLGLAAAIAASAEARQCSERLAGKTIAVETLDQRWLIVFEAGKARVESGDGEADATVRGSASAVVGTFARDRDGGAAIFGDVELFEDFRSAFRPHLKLPEFVGQFAEDAGDAVRVGVNAARSAAEGVAGAVYTKAKDYFPDHAQATPDLVAEVAQLKERVDELETRLAQLEQESPSADEQT